MPDAISVSVTDETPVPQAPDPPCTPPSRWAGGEEREERVPRGAAEEGGHPASPAACARARRAPGAEGAGQGRRCGAGGAGCFACGLLLAAGCAGLAVVPLCAWTAKGQRERRRRRCYAGGACVGVAVFCAWAAALVVVVLARAGRDGR